MRLCKSNETAAITVASPESLPARQPCRKPAPAACKAAKRRTVRSAARQLLRERWHPITRQRLVRHPGASARVPPRRRPADAARAVAIRPVARTERSTAAESEPSPPEPLVSPVDSTATRAQSSRKEWWTPRVSECCRSRRQEQRKAPSDPAIFPAAIAGAADRPCSVGASSARV